MKTKSEKKSDMAIAMEKEIIEEIRAHQGNDPYVFPFNKLLNLNRAHLNSYLKTILDEAGSTPISFAMDDILSIRPDGEVCLLALGTVLSENKNLKSVTFDLYNSQKPMKILERISDIIRHNQTLTSVTIAQLPDKVPENNAFVLALKSNSTLTCFDVPIYNEYTSTTEGFRKIPDDIVVKQHLENNQKQPDEYNQIIEKLTKNSKQIVIIDSRILTEEQKEAVINTLNTTKVKNISFRNFVEEDQKNINTVLNKNPNKPDCYGLSLIDQEIDESSNTTPEDQEFKSKLTSMFGARFGALGSAPRPKAMQKNNNTPEEPKSVLVPESTTRVPPVKNNNQNNALLSLASDVQALKEDMAAVWRILDNRNQNSPEQNLSTKTKGAKTAHPVIAATKQNESKNKPQAKLRTFHNLTLPASEKAPNSFSKKTKKSKRMHVSPVQNAATRASAKNNSSPKLSSAGGNIITKQMKKSQKVFQKDTIETGSVVMPTMNFSPKNERGQIGIGSPSVTFLPLYTMLTVLGSALKVWSTPDSLTANETGILPSLRIENKTTGKQESLRDDDSSLGETDDDSSLGYTEESEEEKSPTDVDADLEDIEFEDALDWSDFDDIEAKQENAIPVESRKSNSEFGAVEETGHAATREKFQAATNRGVEPATFFLSFMQTVLESALKVWNTPESLTANGSGVLPLNDNAELDDAEFEDARDRPNLDDNETEQKYTIPAKSHEFLEEEIDVVEETGHAVNMDYRVREKSQESPNGIVSPATVSQFFTMLQALKSAYKDWSLPQFSTVNEAEILTPEDMQKRKTNAVEDSLSEAEIDVTGDDVDPDDEFKDALDFPDADETKKKEENTLSSFLWQFLVQADELLREFTAPSLSDADEYLEYVDAETGLETKGAAEVIDENFFDAETDAELSDDELLPAQTKKREKKVTFAVSGKSNKQPLVSNASATTKKSVPIYAPIYAHHQLVSTEEHIKKYAFEKLSFESDQNKIPEISLDESQLEALNSKQGLPVTSPAGLNYSFSLQNGVPSAVWTEKKLFEEDEDRQQQRRAMTIINMIDNVLAHSTVVNINTTDPVLASTAEEYISYLKSSFPSFKVTLKIYIDSASSSNHETENNKLEAFKSGWLAKESLEQAPWFKQAVKFRQNSSNVSTFKDVLASREPEKQSNPNTLIP